MVAQEIKGKVLQASTTGLFHGRSNPELYVPVPKSLQHNFLSLALPCHTERAEYRSTESCT